MSSFLKKIFGTIIEKPWEAERAQVDDAHSGQTFDLSVQKSAVIIIFGIACLLYTSPSPRDGIGSRMPSSA